MYVSAVVLTAFHISAKLSNKLKVRAPETTKRIFYSNSNFGT
jgi:hypothetical protein